MKVLVTGATGFIGQEVLKALDNYRCVVREKDVDRFKDTFVVKSIDENVDWCKCLDDIDVIVHLAGIAHNKHESEQQLISVNKDATIALAKAAEKANVKRFVFLSTIGVNGTSSHEEPFSKTSPVLPNNLYSETKYQAECGLLDISESSNLELVIIRPTLVYGVGAPGNFNLLTKIVKLCPVLPFGLVNNKRDFISVKNLADLIRTCIKHPNAPGKVFFASDCNTMSTKDFTNHIAKGLQRRVFQLPIHTSLIRTFFSIIGKSKLSEQLLENLQVESSDLMNILEWTPPYKIEEIMGELKGENYD